MALIEKTLKKGHVVRKQQKTFIVGYNFGRVIGITDIGRLCFAVYVIVNYEQRVVSAYPNPK